jgi:hypothetical protein
MLQGTDGLPLSASPPDYPLAVQWDGILVDDPGHRADILGRIHEVFEVIWADRADAVYREALDILAGGGHDLRPWFRADFFEDHIGRYSKSRRKAPIYWCLSTPSRSYAVWLYYHRLSRDTMYKVLRDYVQPKLDDEDRRLAALRRQVGANPTAAQRTALDAQEEFVAELTTFRDEIARVAPLWNPNLNDGVILNFAPLWRLAPHPRTWQTECKDTWAALVAGSYDWAHLAMHLWPARVIPKCTTDRSLAIAHGIEDEFWAPDANGKWRPREVASERVQELIAERESPAITAALAALHDAALEAPPPKKARARASVTEGTGARRGRPKTAVQVAMAFDEEA